MVLHRPLTDWALKVVARGWREDGKGGVDQPQGTLL
jgi:hypothetical protein